ncbi:MAG TPA: hypothetical protein VE596_07955 [Gaiellaceae bacterium]|nr:hypothetical protein [Gaiellaceae bacterium]
MRKPRSLLGLVHPEPLEPPVEVLRQGRRARLFVVEDEHSDAAGLSVASHLEACRSRLCGRLSKGFCDGRHLRSRPPPEESQRDVEVRPDDPADPPILRELASPPFDEAVADVVGKP